MRAARNLQLQLRDRDLTSNLEKSSTFASEEGLKAAGSHRILQVCLPDLLRCQNNGAHDPYSAVLPGRYPRLACPEHTGFRTSHLCEDQILRVMQTISDGYQATKPKRTVPALLDFSNAFDRAWKGDLLLRAVDKGLPLTFAKWLRDFLSNRQAGRCR